MTLKTAMNKKKKRFYKLMLSQLRYDDLPEVADHLAHILEMENEKYDPEDKLFDIFSDPAKYASVDKDHAYLTSPKVIMVSPATDVENRKKGTPGRKKAVTPKKTATKAPEPPAQITRSGRAVRANRRFTEDMQMGSSDEEGDAVRVVGEVEISEEEDEDDEEPEPEPVKRGRGRPPKNKAKKDDEVIGSITVMDDDTPRGKRGARRQSVDEIKGQDDKKITRGSLSKGDQYLVKGKPKLIRKPKDEDIASRKRTHSQVDDEKVNSAKKSKVSEIVDRITSKRDAKKGEEDGDENEEHDEVEEGESADVEKVDPYSPDFSVTKFATWLKGGKKNNKGWKKAGESPKAKPKKTTGKGWVKITSQSKEGEDEIEEADDMEDTIVQLAEQKQVKQKQTPGEKPYSCGVCGQRFTQKAHIGPHMLTHTGAKSFECKYCFTKFRQKAAMTEHMRRMHAKDGERPHVCKECPIGFWSSGALQHHMKVAHKSPSKAPPPPKKEIILPPPAQPEPVNLFEGKYVCSLCEEKYDDIEDLADHVKTHLTPLEEEVEIKNAQIAAEARAQAIEREQIAMRELEEANRLAAERAAAGEEEPKAELEIPTITHRGRGGMPIKIPAGMIAGSSRGGTPKGSKVPLENVVISTPSGLKFTIKASPQTLKGSKYKLAAVPLKGLSQQLKSGMLKLAPSSGGAGRLLSGAKGSPQQIKMKILGGEGDGSVFMSTTQGGAGVPGTILDLKDITKTAADMSGVGGQSAEDLMSAPSFTTSVVGNDTVISVQPKAAVQPPPPPPPPQPQPADQTYYQCGDCSALFETMDAIQAHLHNECQGAAQANAAATAAVAQEAMGVDNLGTIPSVDASDMTGTTTIDLGHQIAPGTSLITESGAVIDGSMISADPSATIPMSSVAFDAGLQVMATAAGMTSLAPTSLHDPNEAVPGSEEQQFDQAQAVNEESAALHGAEQPVDGDTQMEAVPEEALSMDETAAATPSVNDPNSEAVSEASADIAGSVSGTGEAETSENPLAEESAPVDGMGDNIGSTEQPMETNATESTGELLEMPVTGEKENDGEAGAIPATSGESIGVTQILNIPGMDSTQSIIQSMPGTTAPYEGQKMISILNQPGVVQTQNGQGDGMEGQNSTIISADSASGNFENVVLSQGGDGSIVQTQQGDQLTLVDQSQAVTLPDGQQIVTYMDENGQLAGNGAQQIQVVTTESGETYQIALPEGAANQGPMQYVTEDGQILTVKGSDLAANQGEYMVVDNGNLGGVPVTQAQDNVQYVVYTSSS